MPETITEMSKWEIRKELKETLDKAHQYHLQHKSDLVRMELSWYDLLEQKLPEEEREY